MAITIQQQPTTPNMSNNDLLFVLTSNKITEAQYQYVCDIYISGSGTLVQRIQQQPNPNGKGVFNVGNILHLTSKVIMYGKQLDLLPRVSVISSLSLSSVNHLLHHLQPPQYCILVLQH